MDEGVVFYFDVWKPVLKLGNKTVGRYARAAIMYAQHRRVQRDFASEERGALWLAIRDSIDEQREERD